jgi:Flp pilus assembly pilin Flp
MRTAGLYQMMGNSLRAVLRDRQAVTSVEYALIALLIVLAIVGGISRIGTEVAVPFNQVASEL